MWVFSGLAYCVEFVWFFRFCFVILFLLAGFACFLWESSLFGFSGKFDVCWCILVVFGWVLDCKPTLGWYNIFCVFGFV